MAQFLRHRVSENWRVADTCPAACTESRKQKSRHRWMPFDVLTSPVATALLFLVHKSMSAAEFAVSLLFCPGNHGNCESKWPGHSQSRRWNRRPSRWLGIRPSWVQRTGRARSTSHPRFRFDSAGSSRASIVSLSRIAWSPFRVSTIDLGHRYIFLRGQSRLFYYRVTSCSFARRNIE